MKDFAIIAFYLMALPAQDVVPVAGSAFNQSLREAGFQLELLSLEQQTAPGFKFDKNKVAENYKKQQTALLDAWINFEENRPLNDAYRTQLQNSYEAAEAAYPAFKSASVWGYVDAARQITVNYVSQDGNVQFATAYVPLWSFKPTDRDKTMETVLSDAASAFETMTGAPLDISIKDAMDTIYQMANGNSPEQGHPLLLGDTNGRVMLTTTLMDGLTLIYLPREDVEGMADLKYWFGVYNFMPF